LYRPILSLTLIALAALTAATGCAGSRFDGSVYRGEGYAFRVGPTPATWRRVNVSGGALAFRDDENDATIAANGRCGVDGDDVPLAALTQHLFLAFTDREILQQRTTTMDGREAMNTLLLAKLDGVPKKFDVWVLKKDGCVYDLYFIARPDRFDRCDAAFQRFVQGFAAIPSHAD
jgi:hypothetical protein